jgi:hypothetical protein
MTSTHRTPDLVNVFGLLKSVEPLRVGFPDVMLDRAFVIAGNIKRAVSLEYIISISTPNTLGSFFLEQKCNIFLSSSV